MYLFYDEIKDYIGFDDQDAALLRELGPEVEPHLYKVADHHYEALSANPRTMAVFTGPEQIERLKNAFRVWVKQLFCGIYDDTYFQMRQNIGRVHVMVGLHPHFMFAAMNLVRDDMLDILALLDKSVRHRDAMLKLLDIEMAIMVQSYCDKMTEVKMQVPAVIAAGVAHEIRNPLNAIGLQMTLLSRRLRKLDVEPETFNTIIESVQSELRRMRGLTSEILDFTKPIDISASWHNGEHLLQGLQSVHGPTLEASNITLTTRLVGPPELYCDSDRIIQVLVNLLQNSAEAMDNEGHIEIELENKESLTVLTFRDDGPGMPEEVRFRVFELFFTTKASGTGMGLPIVQKIIEGHGGSIRIDPTSHENGTTFRVLLPRPTRLRVPERDEEE